ncbi:MAG: BON domain-containing protein [Heteroscytonema crispum UTEX LB 1556]
MKKLTSFLITSLLVFGTAACQNAAKTSESAPDNVNQPVTETPAPQATEAAKKDAQSEVRRAQLDSNIRANEQRNNATNDGNATNRSESQLQSEVSSKLEANIPRGSLTVAAAEDGTVTVSGTVTNQDELKKIGPLAKQIKGVKNVVVKAIVAKPKS